MTQTITFKFLEWDSEFFKKNIYQVHISGQPDVQELKKRAKELNADLVYIFAKEKSAAMPHDFKLVDSKVIYHKQAPVTGNMPDEHIRSATEKTPQLTELALLSGHYSRFRLDDRLNHRFIDFYNIWLDKSLQRQLASEVFAYVDDGQELGFVTVKKNGHLVTIGLIAVAREQHNRNIGSKLLQLVDFWTLSQSADQIEVATQMDNIQACRFYEKNGYKIKQIDYIYHYYTS